MIRVLFLVCFQVQNERADNTALRAENERIYCENLAIKDALKNLICTTCDGPPFDNEEDEEQRQRSLESLKQENALLKEEASSSFWHFDFFLLRLPLPFLYIYI